MNGFLARAQVVLGSFVTYLVLAVAVLNVVVAELAPFEHIDAVGVTVRALTAAGSVAAVAVDIIRRVTQVIPEHVGLLPVDEIYADRELPFD